MTATIVLDQQVRNGSYDGGSIAVTPGATTYTVDTTMSTVDATNPDSRANITVKASWDGTNYLTFPGCNSGEWLGGVPDHHGIFRGPNVTASLPADAGGNYPVRIMATLDTEGTSLNTGMTLQVQ